MAVCAVCVVAVVMCCGVSAEAMAAREVAVWWRAAGAGLLRAWARREAASEVHLMLLLLDDGEEVKEKDNDDDEVVAAAWEGTVMALISHLTRTESSWVYAMSSMSSPLPWHLGGGTLLVAPLLTPRHVHFLSTVLGRISRLQTWRWLLLSSPTQEALLSHLFLPHNNQVVVARAGDQVAVELWEQYQVAPGLPRHLNLLGTWAPPPLQDPGGEGEGEDALTLTLTLLPPPPPRTTDMTGLHIRCVTEEWQPFTVLHDEGSEGRTRVTGVFYEMWKVLQDRLNFTYECRRPPDGEWGVQREDGSWSGMVGELVEGRADVVVGNMDQTLVRTKAVDFVVPIVYSVFRLLVRKSSSSVSGWSSYSMEFTRGSWLCLGATVGVCCIAFTVVLSVGTKEQQEQHAAQEATLIVLGCMCLQGPTREESRWSGRLVLLTVCLFGLLTVTHYSSVMISFLALTLSHHPVSSMGDLLSSSTHMLGIIRGTSTQDMIQGSRMHLYHEVWTKLLAPHPERLVASNDEGVRRAIEEDFVFLIDENTYMYRYSMDCRLMVVGPKYLRVASSFVFRNNLSYKHIFDQELTRMLEAGVLDREMRRVQRKAECETASIAPIGLENTFTALLLLSAGIVLSLLVFVAEIIASRLRPHPRPSPPQPRHKRPSTPSTMYSVPERLIHHEQRQSRW